MTPLPDRHSGAPLPGDGAEARAGVPNLLDSLPALVWETDRDLRFTCLTGAAVGAAAVSAAQYLGRPISEFFAGARAAEIRLAHQVALLGETGSFGAEANGRELRGNVRPLVGPDGAVAGVIGVALDLTERVVAERAPHVQIAVLRDLLDVRAALDATGRITAWETVAMVPANTPGLAGVPLLAAVAVVAPTRRRRRSWMRSSGVLPPNMPATSLGPLSGLGRRAPRRGTSPLNASRLKRTDRQLCAFARTGRH